MKLSALYCVRNAMEFFPLSVRTIMDGIDELVICDNRSDDGTLEYARSLRGENPGKVKLIEMTTTFDEVTEFGTRNHAKKYVTGDWIMMMDADQLLSDGWRGAVAGYLNPKNDAIRIRYEHYVGSYRHIQKDFYERQKNPKANNYTPLYQTTFFRNIPTLKCHAAAEFSSNFREFHHACFDPSVKPERIAYVDNATCFHYGFCWRDMMRVACYRAGRGDHGHTPEIKAERQNDLRRTGNPFMFCSPVVPVDYGPEKTPSVIRDKFYDYELELDADGFIKKRTHVPSGEVNQ